MMKTRALKSMDGFTLIEMISALLIVSILAVVIMPRFSTSNMDITLTAQTLRTDLRFAQKLAMSRNTTSGITFTQNATTYTLDDPENVFDETRDLPTGITISSTTKTITYNRFGEPTFAGASDTVSISDGSESRTLTIERYTGNISIS